MIVLNQFQITQALREIAGDPAEALRRRDAATTPEDKALWSLVHRQSLHKREPKGGCGCGR